MRQARAIAVSCVALGLLGLAGCGNSSSLPQSSAKPLPPSSSSPPPPTSSSLPPIGTVADSGFRPGADGFEFANYGGTLPDGSTPVNLTPADVEMLFGSSVCLDAASGKCDLIPEAEAWMNEMNQQMADGHCFGFSVAAELAWQKKINTSAYGAPTINDLSIDHNAALQNIIAEGWVYQTFAAVQADEITGTPNKILSELERLLKPHPAETYTITIWKRDGTGGHAVTPYEVQYKGNGQYEVLIYDNNWPNQARAIAFDTNKDTWSYEAASNPGDTSQLYEGDANSNTLKLFPTSPGQGTQPCPFCGTVPSNGSTTGTTGAARAAAIYLTGSITNHSQVLVTDQAGQHLGYLDGKLVNQIPGAHYVLLTSDQDWKNKLEPILYVPANVAYTITLDGSRLTAPDSESIGVIGPSWHIAINNIPMHPGDKDSLALDPNASKLTYHSTRAQVPTIEAAVSDTRADYAFVISGVSSQPGSTINLRVPPEGGSLIITNVGSSGASSVNLQMTRSTKQGVQRFRHNGIALISGATADLQFGNWTNPSQSIPLVTTRNGHPTNQSLTNE